MKFYFGAFLIFSIFTSFAFATDTFRRPSGIAADTSIAPPNAIGISGIQALDNWKTTNDSHAQGSSSGKTKLVSSPSRSGSAREFVTDYSNSGAERYSVSFFKNDRTSTNFVYDGWVYLTRSSSRIANLEMDLNQTMPNGQTVIFGIQCDGYSGTWAYTENLGTPERPKGHWAHSKVACNPRNWSADTWHHVQFEYSRDDSGEVTYKAVYFDGVESDLNVTVLAARALGWGTALSTNFQVDGLGSSGSSTVYLDDLTIYRW